MQYVNSILQNYESDVPVSMISDAKHIQLVLSDIMCKGWKVDLKTRPCIVRNQSIILQLIHVTLHPCMSSYSFKQDDGIGLLYILFMLHADATVVLFIALSIVFHIICI